MNACGLTVQLRWPVWLAWSLCTKNNRMKNATSTILLFVTVLILSGCCGPANWAENLSREVKCGMSVEGVQALTRRPVEKVEVPRKLTTHIIRDDFTGTDLWLGFNDNKLQYVKVLWAYKIMKMASFSRVDIYNNEMLD